MIRENRHDRVCRLKCKVPEKRTGLVFKDREKTREGARMTEEKTDGDGFPQ